METKIYKISEIDKIVNDLNNDEVVAIATDTVMGLAIKYNSQSAYKKLLKAKGDRQDKPFALMVSSLEMLSKVVVVDKLVSKLVSKWFPGPITFVFKKRPDVNILGLNETVAIRMADDKTLIEIVSKLGVPIMLTSANKSHQQTSKYAKEVYKIFNSEIASVLDKDAKGYISSSIIDVSDNQFKLLRAGNISLKSVIESVSDNMKIAVASDHAAYSFKVKAVAFLKEKGYEVEDFGTNSDASVDYPDFIYPAAKSVALGKNDLGIVMCGSGIGASITANKVNGIRAALVYDKEIAKVTKEHNDSNVLVLGPRFTDEQTLFEIMENWISTDFSYDNRHINRIEKLRKVEENER